MKPSYRYFRAATVFCTFGAASGAAKTSRKQAASGCLNGIPPRASQPPAFVRSDRSAASSSFLRVPSIDYECDHVVPRIFTLFLSYDRARFPQIGRGFGNLKFFTRLEWNEYLLFGIRINNLPFLRGMFPTIQLSLQVNLIGNYSESEWERIKWIYIWPSWLY